MLDFLLAPIGYRAVHKRRLLDAFLHRYISYEAYRDTQIRRKVRHGSRKGFEQTFIRSQRDFEATGTDILPTTDSFPNSAPLDFQHVKPERVGAFDFVYSNSLEQSWNPRAAVVPGLNQGRGQGDVVVELTELGLSPMAACERNPFGVRPAAFPSVISDWFGLDVSVRVVKGVKPGDTEVWLFFIRKLKPLIA